MTSVEQHKSTKGIFLPYAWRKDLFVFVLLAILVSIHFWNLWTSGNISTHIIGDGGDAPMFVWNLWWVKYSLLVLHQSPLHTTFLFYPAGTTLLYHTLAIINGIISLPLQAVLPIVTTANILFVIQVYFAAICAYLLGRNFALSRPASVVAAVMYAFAPVVFAQALGHFNITTVWYIPLVAVLAKKLFDSSYRSVWLAIGLGATLGLSVMNDFYIGSFAAITMLTLTFGLNVLSKKVNVRRFLTMALIAFAAMIIVLIPYIHEYYVTRTIISLPPVSAGEINMYATDLLRFVTPSFLRPFANTAFVGIPANGVSGSEGVSYLGIAGAVLLFAALIGAIVQRKTHRAKETVLMLVLFILFCWLALGPIVHFEGQVVTWRIASWTTTLGLPYQAMEHVPILNSLRVPSRFVIPAMLWLGMLAAVGFDSIAMPLSRLRLNRWWWLAPLSVVAITGIMVDFATTLRYYDGRISSSYTQIANDRDDVAVLELPLFMVTGRGWQYSSGGFFSKQQMAQTTHQKRLINGFISYADRSVTETVATSPALHWLAYPDAEPTPVELDGQAALATFQSLRIRYVVINLRDQADEQKTWYSMSPDRAHNLSVYLLTVLNAQVIANDGIVSVYKIPGI